MLLNIVDREPGGVYAVLVTVLYPVDFAERLGFEPRQRLPVDRLAICSITTLAPLQLNINIL